jgi:hypothetical protein
MNDKISHFLAKAVKSILKPLISIVIRHGIAYGTFAEWVREVYVTAAINELERTDQKQTVTNISTLTGLNRKEAKRLLEPRASENDDSDYRFNRAARVITAWQTDSRFCTKSGIPKILIRGANAEDSFDQLVKDYSGDMTPVSLLQLLESAGCISIDDKKIKLIKTAYIPQGNATSIEKINILGNDVYELISTINHNLYAHENDLRFQRKVFNTLLNSNDLQEFKSLAASESQQLLEKLHVWLSQHEIDPASDSQSHTVSLGIFYHEQSNFGETNENTK